MYLNGRWEKCTNLLNILPHVAPRPASITCHLAKSVPVFVRSILMEQVISKITKVNEDAGKEFEMTNSRC